MHAPAQWRLLLLLLLGLASADICPVVRISGLPESLAIVADGFYKKIDGAVHNGKETFIRVNSNKVETSALFYDGGDWTIAQSVGSENHVYAFATTTESPIEYSGKWSVHDNGNWTKSTSVTVECATEPTAEDTTAKSSEIVANSSELIAPVAESQPFTNDSSTSSETSTATDTAPVPATVEVTVESSETSVSSASEAPVTNATRDFGTKSSESNSESLVAAPIAAAIEPEVVVPTPSKENTSAPANNASTPINTPVVTPVVNSKTTAEIVPIVEPPKSTSNSTASNVTESSSTSDASSMIAPVTFDEGVSDTTTSSKDVSDVSSPSLEKEKESPVSVSSEKAPAAAEIIAPVTGGETGNATASLTDKPNVIPAINATITAGENVTGVAASTSLNEGDKSPSGEMHITPITSEEPNGSNESKASGTDITSVTSITTPTKEGTESEFAETTITSISAPLAEGKITSATNNTAGPSNTTAQNVDPSNASTELIDELIQPATSTSTKDSPSSEDAEVNTTSSVSEPQNEDVIDLLKDQESSFNASGNPQRSKNSVVPLVSTNTSSVPTTVESPTAEISTTPETTESLDVKPTVTPNSEATPTAGTNKTTETIPTSNGSTETAEKTKTVETTSTPEVTPITETAKGSENAATNATAEAVIATENTTTEITPIKETPLTGTETIETTLTTPANETAAETPTDETPTDETPAYNTPTVETPAAESPADETPSNETPTDKTPTVETPTAETPTDETPAAETPTAETPSKTPADKTPTVETPTAETPTDETPTVKTPAETAPAETPAGATNTETPVAETPAAETPATETPEKTPPTETEVPVSPPHRESAVEGITMKAVNSGEGLVVSIEGAKEGEEYLLQYSVEEEFFPRRQCCIQLGKANVGYQCRARETLACTSETINGVTQVEFTDDTFIPSVEYYIRIATERDPLHTVCVEGDCAKKYVIPSEVPASASGIRLDILVQTSESEDSIRTELTEELARSIGFEANRIQLAEFSMGVASLEIRPNGDFGPASGIIAEKIRCHLNSGKVGNIDIKKIIGSMVLHECRDGIFDTNCDKYKKLKPKEEVSVTTETVSYLPVILTGILIIGIVAGCYMRMKNKLRAAEFELSSMGFKSIGTTEVPVNNTLTDFVAKVLEDLGIPNPPTEKYSAILKKSGFTTKSQLAGLSKETWKSMGLPNSFAQAVAEELSGDCQEMGMSKVAFGRAEVEEKKVAKPVSSVKKKKKTQKTKKRGKTKKQKQRKIAVAEISTPVAENKTDDWPDLSLDGGIDGIVDNEQNEWDLDHTELDDIDKLVDAF